MIVDSSAMVAMLLEEPEGHLLDVAIAKSPMSAVCRLLACLKHP